MQSWTISKKLFLLSALNFSILAGVIGFSYLTTQGLTSQLKHIGANDLPAVRSMALTDMIHDGMRAVVLRGFLSVYQNSAKELKESREEYTQFSRDIADHIKKIGKLNVSAETKRQSVSSIEEVNRYVAAGDKILTLLEAGDLKSAINLQDDYQQAFESLEGKLEVLGDLIEKETAGALNTDSERAHLVSIIMALVGCSLSLLIPFLLNRSLVTALASIVVRMESQKQALKEYTFKMEASAKDLNDASVKQASAMEETATALEQISSMVARTSENSRNLANGASESDQSAERGQQSVFTMKQNMERIKDSNVAVMNQINDSNTQIQKIVDVVNEIGEKTKVINDIVFQTKLLSFNASVEAARAGEHGKGFAVVAEEVGNLAQMSGNASRQIAELLAKSINEVHQIVASSSEKTGALMKSNAEKVDTGRANVDNCDRAFAEVVTQVADVKRLTGEISSAIQEQTTGLQEINSAMALFNSTTQENARAASDVSLIAEQLQEQFNAVDELMQEMARLVHGTDRPQQAAHTMELLRAA